MSRKYNRQEHPWLLIQNGEQSDNIVRNQLVGTFMTNEEVLTSSKMLVGTGKDKLQILESKVVWRGNNGKNGEQQRHQKITEKY